MTRDLAFWLDKLESMIDLDHVARTRELQRRAFAFEPVDHVPTVISYALDDGEWPSYGYLDIFEDREKMLLSELRQVYTSARLQADSLYGIRANYGTGIIASMFGCGTVTFENSLPIGTRVSPDALERILDNGPPDVRAGLAGRALGTVAYYRDVLRPYPRLSQTVGSQLLDIQGPFDNASIIWGSDIFLACYDQPERVRRLVQLVTDAIAAVVREHRRIDGCPVDENDGALNFLGGVCVRNDSSINLSGEHFDLFCKPYDAQLYAEFGGWCHFCGRAHQWWRRMLDLPRFRGVNPYQGEFYDLADVFEASEAARVAVVQWTVPVDARCRERIRTGFSRTLWAADLDDARRCRDLLHTTGHADS